MTTMRTGRDSNLLSVDNTLGPGAYDVGSSFGSNSKGFTIGRKREARQEHSPGPVQGEWGERGLSQAFSFNIT